MIRLDRFTVRYPDFTLGPLDLSITAGERVALVGANGAGKSTTIRAIAGRLGDYEGSVQVLGQEVADARVEIRGRVGVLPETLLGLGWMTVAEHLDFLSSFYSGWDEEYAGTLCEEMELTPEKRLGALSKGMKVKLSFVAAAAHRPPVLLLDEPTSGVDPVMRDQLLASVDRAIPMGGKGSLLFSTHILEDVEAVAQRVLLLKDGRLVGDAPVSSLLREGEGEPLSKVIRRRLAHA